MLAAASGSVLSSDTHPAHVASSVPDHAPLEGGTRHDFVFVIPLCLGLVLCRKRCSSVCPVAGQPVLAQMASPPSPFAGLSLPRSQISALPSTW